MSKAFGEHRARHADGTGELFQRPGMRRILVEFLQRASDAVVAQAREPTGILAR
jgi:hypothetical protein